LKGKLVKKIHNACWIVASLSCWHSVLFAQNTRDSARWQAQYTQIYYNNLESASPASQSAGPGLLLLNGASITTDPAVVVGGNISIRLTNGG
jgi:hypothetical protein